MFDTQLSEKIEKFLLDNGFFVFAYSYYNPYFTTGDTVIILDPSNMSRLRDLLFEANKVHHFGETSSGQTFVTTSYGLVLETSFSVLSDIIEEKSFYSLQSGDRGDAFRIIFPNTTLELISKGVLPNLGGFNGIFRRQFKEHTKKDILENIEKRKIKAIEEEKARKRYAENKKEFINYMVTLKNGSEILAERLWNFDWYYSYSDDGNVYRRGVKQEEELMNELVENGFDKNKVIEILKKFLKG